MALQNVMGQDHAISLLQKAFIHKRLAHAYLFYGPSGIGKKLTALQFAKTLYCATRAADACDDCPSCRRITAGNHPDVVLISPESNSIKIEHIRAMQRQLSYKPYEAQRTTIIIDGCELLTLPAQNAVLKILEEPPASALLLLLASKKDALPLTIVSRCQLVMFRPLSPAYIRTILEHHGMDHDLATLAGTLAEGRLDVLNKSDLPQSLARRQQAYTMLQELVQANALSSFTQARQIAAKREQCEELLHWLGLFCRDLIILKTEPTLSLYNHDLCKELTSMAHTCALEGLLNLFTSIERCRAMLQMNINPQLLFENLVLQQQQNLRGEAP